MEAITQLPRAGRRLRNVSARSLARSLGYDRETVCIMLTDLERAGRIRRLRHKGKCGVLFEILDHT